MIACPKVEAGRGALSCVGSVLGGDAEEGGEKDGLGAGGGPDKEGQEAPCNIWR